MCTISWTINESGYSVFFNRDEGVLRPRAVPPKFYLMGSVKVLMPVDPQGGGTWLAVNEFGLSVALLNFYQGRLPKGHLISRGQIVKACAEKKSVGGVVALLESLRLSKYAPFSLLIFDRSGGASFAVLHEDTDQLGQARPPVADTGAVTLLRWTGKVLNKSTQISPLISSAINFATVCESRLHTYANSILLSEGGGTKNIASRHRALHASHYPAKSALSICMHRDDAQTVSFSQINVSSKKIEYFYADGAPCETETVLSATMPTKV